MTRHGTSGSKSRAHTSRTVIGTRRTLDIGSAGTALERTSDAAQRQRAAIARTRSAGVGTTDCVALARRHAGDSRRGRRRCNESVMRVPVVKGGERAYIDVTVFRPEGAGPFPIVVLSHGSPRSARERRAEGRQRMAAQSEPFLAMGFAVIVPTRRGYGDSEGDWAEGFGSCANPDYYTAGLESARDMRAAVDAVRREALGRCAPRRARGAVRGRLRLRGGGLPAPSRAWWA